jgi:hypothetical protein
MQLELQERTVRKITPVVCLVLLANAASAAESTAAVVPSVAAHDAATYAAVPRLQFNRQAVVRNLPLFWVRDADADNALDPDELAVTWGAGNASLGRYVKDGRFTPEFAAAYALIAQPVSLDGLPAAEKTRRQLVMEELAQGRPTLVQTTLADPRDVQIFGHLENTARIIERLFARQRGVYGLAARIPASDTESSALFFRNQSPFCEAPGTENDPNCSALSPRPKNISGMYPASIQTDTGFCTALEKRTDAVQLLNQFSIVSEKKAGGRAAGNPATDELVAIPYHVAYSDDMKAVSNELRAAAALLAGDPSEAAFKAYLEAAAQAFLDGSWFKADAAWKAMTATNSKWYLRVAPDEVYDDPCSRKANFAMRFARINQESLEWQRRLEPVKDDMEAALAALAGPPYKARQVGFALPDFIDIVLNAGYDRYALGAVIGQSLPNWGPVAESGGRTVAMTNLYTDPDSEAASIEQARSVMCKATADRVDHAPRFMTMSTVLHEAAHNLGPAHEYRVDGKTDGQVFGGPLASTLEELKAQTAALYFSDWLAARGVLSKEDAVNSHLRDVLWAFGHIAAGMVDAQGRPKPYSQLAAIQMGFLNQRGVLVWKADEKAANGTDTGCFEVDLAKWPAAVDDLARLAFGIKSRGDRALAEKTRDEYVTGGTKWAELRRVIEQRWQRAPRASFVYSVQ